MTNSNKITLNSLIQTNSQTDIIDSNINNNSSLFLSQNFQKQINIIIKQLNQTNIIKIIEIITAFVSICSYYNDSILQCYLYLSINLQKLLYLCFESINNQSLLLPTNINWPKDIYLLMKRNDLWLNHNSHESSSNSNEWLLNVLNATTSLSNDGLLDVEVASILRFPLDERMHEVSYAMLRYVMLSFVRSVCSFNGL